MFFLKGEYWVICDRVRSDGRHRLGLHLHWAPDTTAWSEVQDIIIARPVDANGPEVSARIFARAGQLSCEQGWVSTAYGTRAPAPIHVFRLDSERTEELVTVLANSTNAVRLEDCAWHASGNAGVLTVATASTSDTILTGPTMETERARDGVISDATWTWVRRSLSGDLLAFALIRGRSLIIDNRREFQADRVVDCAIGQRGRDGSDGEGS